MALGGSEVLIGLTVASVLATAAGTYVAYEGAQEQKAALKQQGEYNSQVAENNANAATAAAAADATRQRDRNRRIAGAQNAAFAKSGTSLDSVDDVLFDSAVQGELDALTIEHKGALEADRYRTGGTLSMMESSNAADAAGTRGTSTLISGIASTANQGYDLYKNNPKMR